jgi:hypothetical protein
MFQKARGKVFERFHHKEMIKNSGSRYVQLNITSQNVYVYQNVIW